jgi:hypothetical protein
MVEVLGQWYIFYHRHTNGTCFSRQTCAEAIEIKEDGSIPQVELTSCGLNGGPLLGRGEYPAYIAGFKYFDCKGVRKIGVRTRGYGNGDIEVKTAWDGKAIAKIPVEYTNVWRDSIVDVDLPDGIYALYFEFKGEGGTTLGGIILE